MTSTATRRRIEGIRPAAGATTVTDRIANGQDDLTTASTMGLLTAAYALTHRMDREHGDTPAAADLRAQRDLITAEVLRRAGA